LSDHTAQRQLNRGYGDALSGAFEIAITPVLFGGLGYLLDSWLDTAPVFMISLGLFAITGVFVKMWFVYDRQMGEEEQQVDHTGRSRPPLVTADRKQP
jgi:F0F1-type ATP synthase assembly protein I